ncbi:MAG: hypothetical protein ABW101_02330 [Candidatus Thiodiazotropha sp.]
MNNSGPYRFRLRFASVLAGKFAIKEPDFQFEVSDGQMLEVAARNAETLDAATNYHIDGAGFESAEAATFAAESLRVRLRLLNTILGLGLNIPVGNRVTCRATDKFKRKVNIERGATLVDSIWGISVYPDDGLHHELFVSGNVVVKPRDSEYLFEGIKTLWNLDINLDKQSEDALQILCLATQEASDKASFLASYLALEELIERHHRSDAAKEALQHFIGELGEYAADNTNPLLPEEADSLKGVLGSLSEESFRAALTRLGRQIEKPTEICGLTVPKFLSTCVAVRNRIAHHADPETKIPLRDLTKSLREFVLMLIWTRNKLPNISLNTPSSTVNIPTNGLKIHVV